MDLFFCERNFFSFSSSSLFSSAFFASRFFFSAFSISAFLASEATTGSGTGNSSTVLSRSSGIPISLSSLSLSSLLSSVSGGDEGLEENSSFSARSGTEVSHTSLSDAGCGAGFVGTTVGFGVCIAFGG